MTKPRHTCSYCYGLTWPDDGEVIPIHIGARHCSVRWRRANRTRPEAIEWLKSHPEDDGPETFAFN